MNGQNQSIPTPPLTRCSKPTSVDHRVWQEGYWESCKRQGPGAHCNTRASTQLSHWQSPSLPTSTLAPWDPVYLTSLFWIIIMSPSKILSFAYIEFWSPHLFLLPWHACHFHSICLQLLDMVLCHLYTSSDVAFKTLRTQSGSPAFSLLACSNTPGCRWQQSLVHELTNGCLFQVQPRAECNGVCGGF